MGFKANLLLGPACKQTLCFLLPNLEHSEVLSKHTKRKLSPKPQPSR